MTLPIPLSDQIRAELDAIETNVSLRDELNFVGRVEAIDRIEFHLFDHLDVLAHPSDALIDLKQRAQSLIDELTKIDEFIFRRLRAEIVDGSLRGESLRKEFDRYVGKHDTQRGYDHRDVFVNGILRLDTVPQETQVREPEMVFYQPTPARVILELTEMIPITAYDIFYDLGSGLGQVCILVHLLTSARTRGVEFEPAYCDYARESARHLGLSQVEFINGDARAANYNDGTIFFMYTPFKGTMMESVLQKIERESRGRAIRVCAYGDCATQVSNQPWLSLVAQHREGEDALAVFERNDLQEK